MGDERAQVICDGAGGLADAEAGTVLVDHPEAEDGVAGFALGIGEDGGGGDGLADERAFCIRAVCGDGESIWTDDGDVGAFTGVQRLADIRGERAAVSVRFKVGG